MTKETKIGLLVGLAFIVLFAIILSEKGTTHRDNRVPQFTLADSVKNSTNLGTDQPLGDKGRLPVNGLAPIISPTDTHPPVAMTHMEEEQVAQSTIEEEPLPDFPPDLVDSLNKPTNSDSPTPAKESTEMAIAPPKETAPVTKLAVGPTLTSPTFPAIKNSNATKTSPVTESTTPTIKNEPSKETLAKIASQNAIKVKTVYKVEPGESLTKIAAKNYGRSTPQRVDAIYEANRNVLKSPAAVRAGDKLKIPDLGEGFEPAPDFALSTATRTVTPVHTSSDQQLRIPIPMTETPKVDSKFALVPVSKSRTPAVTDKPATKALASPAKSTTKSTETKVASKQPDHSSKSAQKPEGRKKEDAIAYVWYEVKKTDTLSKIAKKEMGSEKDTSALYKINQDIINNRNTIKPGMKIRVPAKLQGTTELPSAITSRGLDASDD